MLNAGSGRLDALLTNINKLASQMSTAEALLGEEFEHNNLNPPKDFPVLRFWQAHPGTLRPWTFLP
jgi:hypothetical protein